MADKKITWQEKVSNTAYDNMYPETDSSQVILNNTINNNLGIAVDSRLDSAMTKISETTKQFRAEGVSTGNALALELSVPVFTLVDGVMARVRIHTNTSANATLNINNTGAKPIIRIDGEPIDLELKQGTWCIFIYSSSLDSWVFEGWSTKSTIKTVIFTENGSWTVPANITSVTVFVMGGGGGGGGGVSYESSGTGWSHEAYGGGGGAGRIKKETLTVTPGNSISVTIGAGGEGGAAKGGTGALSGGNGGNGGATSFGTLLSAAGGEGGKGASASSYYNPTGGAGGAGSAGGGGGWGFANGANGGNGDYCGGGGAGGDFSLVDADAGNGGTYGGGGGAINGNAGTGGTYGGAGGKSGSKIAAKAGTDTTSMSLDFIGKGQAGINGTADGTACGGGGGGGGYGGNGGNGSNGSYIESTNYYGGNGGGGGYGGNGYSPTSRGSGGGGGGYGGNADGSGGGGYGAGNYGKGGNSSSSTGKNGLSGICIITYVAQVS